MPGRRKSTREMPVHYLRNNETEWSPKHIAAFDTETNMELRGTDEVHTLRLWCAQSLRRDMPPTGQHPVSRCDGINQRSLAEWVTAQFAGRRNLWLYAHNLSFDLTVTRLLTHLQALGWAITDFGVDDRNPFFRMAKGNWRLTIVDSWSWLPTALKNIGGLVGVAKPDLPTWDEDDVAWLHRCYGDVDVTLEAIRQLMNWWDKQGCGRWSITGASTGWNAMRHRMPKKAFIVDPDHDARQFERQAIRGGRRDIWRFGLQTEGPYAHLDIVRAHATIAEKLLLPRKRGRLLPTFPLDHRSWETPLQGLIGWALVRCEVPRYPCRWQGGTWWPTGRFWTVLGGPELKMAHRLGDLDAIGPCYRYLLGRGMADWGHWVNELAAGTTRKTPKVAQLAAKSWGRSVVGKWAAHTSTAHEVGASLSPSWGTEKAIRADTRQRSTIVDLCGTRWWVDHELDADESFPAVLAWVESELRVRMAQVVTTLGPGIVVSVDTDGLVVDLGAARRDKGFRDHAGIKARAPWTMATAICDWLAPLVNPLTLRPTDLYDTVDLAGPQHLTLGGDRRMSGVPRGATQIDSGTFRARPWPKLRWQMAHGQKDAYVRPELTYRPRGRYARRWVGIDGQLYAPLATVTGHLETEMVPWGTTPGALPDLWPGQQHPDLAKLGDAAATWPLAAEGAPSTTSNQVATG